MLSSAKELTQRQIFAKCVIIHLHMNGVKQRLQKKVVVRLWKYGKMIKIIPTCFLNPASNVFSCFVSWIEGQCFTFISDDFKFSWPWIISSHILPIPSPWIMNKTIIVCSMKFLPHFPLPMIILFKVYQLENIMCNLNANDSSKYIWGETSHTMLSLPFLSSAVTLQFFFRSSRRYEKCN